MAYHTINISDADFQKSAIKWKKELLLMPIFAMQDTLKYMTGIPGVRYSEKVGAYSSNAQFAPYKSDRKSSATTSIDYRELRTYFGNVVEEFDPDAEITTILGQNSGFLGDAQKTSDITKLVLKAMMASLGEKIQDNLFTAKHSPTGDTSDKLFDGFGTIANAEKTAGNIATGKGNLYEQEIALTSTNAFEVTKDIVRSLDPHLRQRETFFFCSQAFADSYNDGYLAAHLGVPYNQNYEQMYVEGTSHKMTLVPLPSIAGGTSWDGQFFITTKDNMLYGYDNMSDVERIQIGLFSPFMITLSAAMFFGVQFRSIDKKLLKVVNITSKA